MEKTVCKTTKHGAIKVGDSFQSISNPKHVIRIICLDEFGYLITEVSEFGQVYKSNVSKGELNKEYNRC